MVNNPKGRHLMGGQYFPSIIQPVTTFVPTIPLLHTHHAGYQCKGTARGGNAGKVESIQQCYIVRNQMQ